jgi:hypothetical protein
LSKPVQVQGEGHGPYILEREVSEYFATSFQTATDPKATADSVCLRKERRELLLDEGPGGGRKETVLMS